MHRPFHPRGRSTRAVALVIVMSAVALGTGGFPTAAQSPSGAPLGTAGTLPPDGPWQVDLSAQELIAAGSPADNARAGTYTWTFGQGRAMIDADYEDGSVESCLADVAPSGDAMELTYIGNCAGSVETISWARDEAGLHLALISTFPGLANWKAILEAKPWQPVSAKPTIGVAADDGARVVAVDTIDARTRDLIIESPSVGPVKVRLLAPRPRRASARRRRPAPGVVGPGRLC